MNIKGKIKGTGNYSGHHIQVTFTEKAVVSTAEDQYIWRIAQDRVAVSSDGLFLLELASRDQLKKEFTIEVLAPDGSFFRRVTELP